MSESKKQYRKMVLLDKYGRSFPFQNYEEYSVCCMNR